MSLGNNHTILYGDASTILEQLLQDPKEDKKYKLVVTSPPYYLHRRYGNKTNEIGREKTSELYLDKLVTIFSKCKKLLTDDGSIFIVIGDTRRNHEKLLIPHRLAFKLTESGLFFQEDIIWYKKNAVSNSSKTSLTQSYELILFLSKSKVPAINIDPIRVPGNEVIAGNSRHILTHDKFQFKSLGKNTEEIRKITKLIHNSTPETPFSKLPTTNEISWAYGYDPEKHCPTCHRKFKRHATRKRIGGHNHYPIFAVCNVRGKNPGNVWEVSTKAHYGNEHFAVFPEDLISRIVKFASVEGDHILDPFAGRGTTGIVSAYLKRRFTGIDLYRSNITKIKNNVRDAEENRLPQKIINQIKS